MLDKFSIECTNLEFPKMSKEELLSLHFTEVLLSLWSGDVIFSSKDIKLEISDIEILHFFSSLYQTFTLNTLYEKSFSFPTSSFDSEIELTAAGDNLIIRHMSSMTKASIGKLEVKKSSFKQAFCESYLKVVVESIDHYPELMMNPFFISFFPISLHIEEI